MSCYHPLKAFPIGFTESGKTDYLIRSYNVNHIEYHNNKWINCYDNFFDPYSNRWIKDFIEIPCGKCVGCRLEYSRQWANRCMLEASLHDDNYFVTLTYDDEHLPINSFVNEKTGEIGETSTLVKKDLQNFFKRLRKAYEKKYGDEANHIKYFACGEYGSKTARPHYHAVIFGLKLDDLVLYKHISDDNKGQYNLYNSEWLSSIWKFGYVVIGKVNWDTCAYTARYVMKKLNGEAAEVYTDYNFQREFTCMSLKPGIAKEFIEKNVSDYITFGEFNISTEDGARRISRIRYFDNYIDNLYPDLSREIKGRNLRLANSVKEVKMKSTSKSYVDYLRDEELIKKNQISMLKRGEY